MSAERRGRDSGRSPTLFSSRAHLILLVFAVVMDLLCTFALCLLNFKNQNKPFSLDLLIDFSHQSLDMVCLALLRLVVIVIVFAVIFGFIKRKMDAAAEEEDADGEGVGEGSLADASVSENNGYVPLPTEDPDMHLSPTSTNPDRSGAGHVSPSNESVGLSDEAGTRDAFAQERRRSVARARGFLIKTVILFSIFILFTVCNAMVALKCLFFDFTQGHLQEALMAITVLWVNLEVFMLNANLDNAVSSYDTFKPQLHPHPLRFNHSVQTTKCDVCNQRIIREDFECVSCDFDCCLRCYKTKSMAMAENNLTRGDRGISEDDTQLSPLVYIWRSLEFLLPYWKIVAVSIGCLVVNQLIRVSLPNFQGKVLDSIVTGDQTGFWQNMTRYCALSVVTMFLGSARSFCSMLVTRNLTMGMRERLFSRLIYRDISFYDGTTVGSLTARMTNDVQATVQPVQTLMNSVLSNVITLVGAIGMCMMVSWKLAMITLTVVGPIIFITGTYARWSARINRGVWDALAQANSTATEAFTNIRTIRAFSTEEHEKKKFSSSMDEALSKTLRDAVAYSGTFLATSFMDLGSSAVLLGFGGYMIITKPEELTVGQLVTFQLYSGMMNSAYQGLNGVLNQFTKSAGAAERILTMLAVEPDIDPEAGVVLPQLDGTISMDKVRFFYQMRPDRIVLQDLSLTFPQNSVTAIVGRSGGGKSTLMHLVLRMYDPQEGRVLVDGHDIRDLSLVWLHHQCAVVAQDTQLFNTTIEENIAYGLENVSHVDVVNAALAANAHDFITGFPEGYETHVGERGVRLSGGQRQRIAIARALLRRPRVLLLDEATSALDSESEALVQRALDKLIQNLQQSCTIIVIAHRLSTIVNANNIVVVNAGTIAEQGTHEQLLQRRGAYFNLVNRQLQDGAQTFNFDEEVADGAKPAAPTEKEGRSGRGRGRGQGGGRGE